MPIKSSPGPVSTRSPRVSPATGSRLLRPTIAPATTAVPDFVIEVVSPSDRAAEVEEKVRDWLRAGVPLLWHINPMAGVTTVYEGAGGPIRRVEAEALLDAGPAVPDSLVQDGEVRHA